MTGKLERFYPAILGLFSVGLYAGVLAGHPMSDHVADSLQNLFLAVISISAITIGFLATAQSILFSINQTRIIQNLRAVGKYRPLVGYLMAAVRWSFILAIVSAFCLMVDFKHPEWWHPYLLGLWSFAVPVAITTCYRIIHIYAKILNAAKDLDGK
jgi:hypothetical protein